jgi:hypothetical protein
MRIFHSADIHKGLPPNSTPCKPCSVLSRNASGADGSFNALSTSSAVPGTFWQEPNVTTARSLNREWQADDIVPVYHREGAEHGTGEPVPHPAGLMQSAANRADGDHTSLWKVSAKREEVETRKLQSSVTSHEVAKPKVCRCWTE